MRVKDVMTTEVRAVSPRTPLKEVAAALTSSRISGLPVVDPENRVLGVVSEADILVREGGREREPRRGRGWLSGLTARPRKTTAKLSARTAGQSMTQPAVTISPGHAVAEAASLMFQKRIKRLPVVDAEERLVGIITRADIVRAFGRPDADIEKEIEDAVILETLWMSPDELEVTVERGDVILRGDVETDAVADALTSAVARVPGVLSVDPRLRWRKGVVRTRQRRLGTKARIGRRRVRR